MTDQDAAEDAAATDQDAAEDVAEAPEDVDVDEVDLGTADGADEGDPDVSAADAESDTEGTRVDETLVERVADADPEAIASELAALRDRTDSLEAALDEKDAEIEELEGKLTRKQADFQNFKKRMEKRQADAQARATEDLVTRLFDVRDNLKRALEQDEGTDIRDGVEATLRQFDDVLDAEGVEVIDPEPGADVDPTQHQVLARVESDQDPGAIADVHRPGYEMGEKVLREAQVTVSEEE